MQIIWKDKNKTLRYEFGCLCRGLHFEGSRPDEIIIDSAEVRRGFGTDEDVNRYLSQLSIVVAKGGVVRVLP